MLCVALSLCGLLAAPGSAAGPQTTVRLAPAVVQVGAGLTAAVSVHVQDVQDLYGLDIRLAFDPSAVEVVDAQPATPGVQSHPGDLLRLDLLARNTADNSAGTVWFAMTQANPTQEVSGSGTAFTVIFRGRREGARSPLTVTYARLATRDGREIAATCRGGVIEVIAAAGAPATPTPAPSPPVPALILTASAPAPMPTHRGVTPAPAVEGAQAGPRPQAAPFFAALAGCALALGVDRWRRRRRGPA